MLEYKFKPLSKVCHATGQTLVPGTECYSILVEKNGAFERQDYCEQGWNGLPDGAVGFWKSIVPAPEVQQATTADPELLLRLFEQLTDQPNPHQERLAFALALLLLQRRRLRLEGAVMDGENEYLELSGVRGEGTFLVRNQQLSETELAELRDALNQQLSTDWSHAA